MKHKNLPLIIGIALPFVFIIVISAIIYVPGLFISPSHNFVYTLEDAYYRYGETYDTTYDVENNHIVVKPMSRPDIDEISVKEDVLHKGNPPLYLYNVTDNTAHKITLEEAQTLTLDPGPSSPDGYSVSYQYGHDGIFELFGSSGNNNDYFISKGAARKRLQGLGSSERYGWDGDFRLIGWIK